MNRIHAPIGKIVKTPIGRVTRQSQKKGIAAVPKISLAEWPRRVEKKSMSLDFQTTPDPQAWLEEILCAFNCQTGTLHKADGKFLDLVVQTGVPEFLLPKITRIPFGKGIAGVAAERREPVELCNLQEDLGGVARPDARQTQVSGSLAVPVLSPDGERVLGTLGIGMHEPHDFSDDEKARLRGIAARVGVAWSAN